MIRCNHCNYGWNPDTATSCVQCKTPLPSVVAPLRSNTLNDFPVKAEVVRNPTLAEGSLYVSKPVTPSLPHTPPGAAGAASGQTPIGNMGSNAGPGFVSGVNAVAHAEANPETNPGAGPGRTPLASGQRRPQTIAVDPGRKIVGVLITYSWQESGQVFPVLEGRNLIGKDPDQCDICIPQDATLSAVNSFITYRKHFLIGDKVSMSGTDVDGEPIETEFVPLRNYAKIRTGSTYWTFVCVQPPAPAVDDSGSGS